MQPAPGCAAEEAPEVRAYFLDGARGGRGAPAAAGHVAAAPSETGAVSSAEVGESIRINGVHDEVELLQVDPFTVRGMPEEVLPIGADLAHVQGLQDAPLGERDVSFARPPPAAQLGFPGRRALAVLRIQRFWRCRPARQLAPPAAPVACAELFRNGLACPWWLTGHCRYRHPPGQTAAPAREVLLHRTIEAGSTDVGFEQVLLPWALHVQPTEVILHDPYVAAIARGSDLYDVIARCTHESELPEISAECLEQATCLHLVRELLVLLDDNLRRFSKLALCTRGDAMQDRTGRVHAGALRCTRAAASSSARPGGLMCSWSGGSIISMPQLARRASPVLSGVLAARRL